MKTTPCIPARLMPSTRALLLRVSRLLAAITLGSLLPACHDSPQTCFERAVLNTNFMHGFAGRAMEQELDTPSVKLTGAKPGETAPMTRKEVVDAKISFVEDSLTRVRRLRQTDDNRDIIQASIALHEHVLRVYRDEYQQLARLYDTGAPKAEIARLTAAIATNHGPPFQALSAKLTTAGKAYATRHSIKVIWDARTSPSP